LVIEGQHLTADDIVKTSAIPRIQEYEYWVVDAEHPSQSLLRSSLTVVVGELLSLRRCCGLAISLNRGAHYGEVARWIKRQVELAVSPFFKNNPVNFNRPNRKPV